MYKEPDYADSRLRDTVVRFQGKPAYLTRVDNDLNAFIRLDLDSEDEKVVHLDELELSSPPLGYFNSGNKAHYFSRRPLRNDYRQGIRPNQIVVLSGTASPSWGRLMQCIEGKFPSLEEALKTLEQRSMKSVAFSREFCLFKEKGKILLVRSWKGRVGEVVEGKINLDKGKEHLSKLLEVLT